MLRALGVVAVGLMAAGCAESDIAVGQACGPMAPDKAMAHADQVSHLIREEDFRSIIAELAGDAYEGRGPGSAGDAKAREWTAAQLAETGIAPGADDGYQQRFELVGVTTGLPGEWAFSTGVSMAPRTEFVANVSNQTTRASLSDAELVFVGFGI